MQDFNDNNEKQDYGTANGFFRPADDSLDQNTSGVETEVQPTSAVETTEGVTATETVQQYSNGETTWRVEPTTTVGSTTTGTTNDWYGETTTNFQTVQGTESVPQATSANNGWSGATQGDSGWNVNANQSFPDATQQPVQPTYGGWPAREHNTSTEWNGNAAYGNGYGTVPGAGVYTEHVKKAKKSNRGKGIVAVMLILTLLNMMLFAGAFVMGTQFGKSGSRVNSKQDLVDKMRQEPDKKGEGEAPAGEVMDTAEIARTVGPAVVGITSEVEGGQGLFGGLTQSSSEGSGIILSEDGYIVTNNHVVENSNAVVVTLNTGAEYEAEVIGVDEQTDLAVIKIEAEEDLTVATLGDSSKLEVGERVVAIGNPMGLEFFGSVTQGIVSAVNRTISIGNRTMDLIQTDAAINSGNSGGALINAYGEVIGINSVKLASTGVEGMSFAIPISEANPIIADLLEYGYVKGRPIIGVATRDVSFYMAKIYSWPEGAQVMSVTSDSARDAGLEQGDIITKVNGVEITSGAELNQEKDKYKPGDTLELEVYKYESGETETVKVVLSEQIPG